MTRPHAIYRCFSSDGQLLYVGCSWSPMMRAMEHCKLKPWAAIMARIDVEWFDSKQEAQFAEVEAIKAENPAWNCHFAKDKTHSIGVYHPDYDRGDPASWKREVAE